MGRGRNALKFAGAKHRYCARCQHRQFSHQWYSTAQMQELRELLAGRTDQLPMDVVALQIASIEFPELTVEPFLVLLDSYASEFTDRVSDGTGGEEFLTLLNEYLFDELGFAGNQDDYYNPGNSCLNEVLTKRVGIPITLSLVYMEIGRRLGRELHGIGLPGHFLVQFVDRDFSVFVDPFGGGRLLFPAECYELAASVTGVDMSGDVSVLQPVSKRHIALRMLNNLRGAYFRQQNAPKAVKVLDLLIEAMPDSADCYKQRAACLGLLQRYGAAKVDLESYLALAPEATDREQIEKQLNHIRRYLSALS